MIGQTGTYAEEEDDAAIYPPRKDSSSSIKVVSISMLPWKPWKPWKCEPISSLMFRPMAKLQGSSFTFSRKDEMGDLEDEMGDLENNATCSNLTFLRLYSGGGVSGLFADSSSDARAANDRTSEDTFREMQKQLK